MTIGTRISELRKAKGYTQEYVAEQLGVSRQAVSKWEQDQTSPDTGNLIALAKLLDSSVEYIAVGKAEKSDAEAKAERKRIKLHNFCVTGAAFSLLFGIALTLAVPFAGVAVLALAIVFFILASVLESGEHEE